ncbi:MAG TPA: pyruvate formate lyase-activating protein [Firmicutes bacterium]|nr:pyruvate formate lyase-activating protein [Bacillota bacterium]
MAESITGRIHSLESFGAVDGPGVRFVVFMQGCPLRCRFCHNPDTWATRDGEEISAAALVQKILGYKNFIKKGGVTLSGGEPLLQPAFAAEVLRLCRENGLHTAVDTSGCIPLKTAKPVIDAADMLLLDIKDIDTEDAKNLTGRGNEEALEILRYCEQIGRRVWIRHVLLPGYTLQAEKLERLAAFLSGFTCIEKVELLPFHKMGEYKWEELGEAYTLADTPVPTLEEVEAAREIIRRHGLSLHQ